MLLCRMCFQRGLHDLRVTLNSDLTGHNPVSLKELEVKQLERNRLEEVRYNKYVQH